MNENELEALVNVFNGCLYRYFVNSVVCFLVTL